jgi:hypothetical protein
MARDTITGFTGVIVCESKWLHGCRRLMLQPKEMKDGTPVAALTFDEPQLQFVDEKVAQGSGKTGGPRPEPARHTAPAR